MSYVVVPSIKPWHVSGSSFSECAFILLSYWGRKKRYVRAGSVQKEQMERRTCIFIEGKLDRFQSNISQGFNYLYTFGCNLWMHKSYLLVLTPIEYNVHGDVGISPKPLVIRYKNWLSLDYISIVKLGSKLGCAYYPYM